jgi:hypothetical protein
MVSELPKGSSQNHAALLPALWTEPIKGGVVQPLPEIAPKIYSPAFMGAVRWTGSQCHSPLEIL